MSNEFLQKVEVSYDEFSQWVGANTPPTWSPDDVKDLLAYVGFVHFMVIAEKMPGFTITDLDQVIFGGGNSVIN